MSAPDGCVVPTTRPDSHGRRASAGQSVPVWQQQHQHQHQQQDAGQSRQRQRQARSHAAQVAPWSTSPALHCSAQVSPVLTKPGGQAAREQETAEVGKVPEPQVVVEHRPSWQEEPEGQSAVVEQK